MKLVLETSEIVHKTLIVDTSEYFRKEDSEDVFLLAFVINDMKENPNTYFSNDKHSVTEERELTSVNVRKA